LLFPPIREAEYFSKQGWTQNHERRPSGKSFALSAAAYQRYLRGDEIIA
jgi:hypothetical protein